MSEIRELAMRALSQINAECAQAFSDGDGVGLTNSDVERLVRAAMREAYKRAEGISRRLFLAGIKAESGHIHGASARDCELAIRAEADKLEGKP